MEQRRTKNREQQRTGNRKRFRILWLLVPCLAFLVVALPAAAQINTGIDFGTATGLSTRDVRDIVARIIQVTLGLLGMIAVGIVSYGGFLWMTSRGDETQLTRAKQVLANGAIGLTLVLMSFGIASFVISRLTAATQQSTVQVVTIPPIPIIGLPGGCTDPGGTEPFICSASPLSGPVGSYVTVRGYRFGAFAPGTSQMQFGTTTATIVNCGTSPNWSDNLLVAEVPQTLSFGQSYDLHVTNAASVTNAGTNRVTFGVLPGTATGPQIACALPSNGPETTIVTIDGKQFGASPGAIAFGGPIAGTATNWTDTRIIANVPAGAVTGDITVAQGGATSNGYPFQVTCASGAQCSLSGCCLQNQCFPTAACAATGGGGLGTSCDLDPTTPQCQPGACATGLTCATASCTCQQLPSTVGASCDLDLVAPQCQPGQCGGGLRCDATSCTCQLGVTITDVSPQTLVDPATGTTYPNAAAVPVSVQAITAPNGAAGNYVTITGTGFGATAGVVTFVDGSGGSANRTATLASCGTATTWTDTQIIIAIPQNAVAGPIRVVIAGGSDQDQTDDTRGPTIQDFVPNAVQRPGLCAIRPTSEQAGNAVAVAGVQFGASQGANDSVLFGAIAVSPGATTWGATSIQTRVPNLQPGDTGVTVRVGTEQSNGVRFTTVATPIVPVINEILPTSGGPAQYVSIRGANFGANAGHVQFTRQGTTEQYRFRPNFPAQCGTTGWWTDGEVRIRIPATPEEWEYPISPAITPNTQSSGTYDVLLRVPAGTVFTNSNALPFQVTTTPPTPGICTISPASGIVGTDVTLTGEHFGTTTGIARFFRRVVGAPSGWTDTQVKLPVPIGAVTGPVQLWRTGENPDRDDNPATSTILEGNQGSNPAQFDVQDCRTSGCSGGGQCCANGACIPSGQRCPAAGPNNGSYQWTFATGLIPRVPQVVEVCDKANAIFSPAPWDRTEGGSDACVNAQARIQFTTSMASALPANPNFLTPLDPVTAQNGIDVFRCAGGTNIAARIGNTVGDFESGDLAPATLGVATSGWTRPEPTASRYLQTTLVDASALTPPSGPRVLQFHPDAANWPVPALVIQTNQGNWFPPRTSINENMFAIETPRIISDTNGTSWTAHVQVRRRNAQAPALRAGAMIGRIGGVSGSSNWWRTATNEIDVDDTWRDLSVSMNFDPDASGAPGFIRLYVSVPGPLPASFTDKYDVLFDDLQVTQSGDPCAVRVSESGLQMSVLSSGGVFNLQGDSVTITAPTGWQAASWYEVIVYGDPANGKMPLQGLATASTPSLRLDGDSNGSEGGNYRFRFRTRAAGQACALQGLAVQPGRSSLTQRYTPGDPIPQHPGLVHLAATATSGGCYALQASALPIAWSIAQPTTGASGATYARLEPRSVAAPQGRLCTLATQDADCGIVTCRTNADCPGTATCDTAAGRCRTSFCSGAPARCQNLPNTVTASAERETPIVSGTPNPAVVAASVTQGTAVRTATAGVTVQFQKPRITNVYPAASCTEACPNGAIAAIANMNLDATTVRAGTVRLFRCTTESCSRAEITAATPEPTTASVCDQNQLGCGVSAEPQIVVAPTGGQSLLVDTSYRIIISNSVRSAFGVALDGLNYADNQVGTIDAYSWTFRTRSQACGVGRIDTTPNPVTFRAIGERQPVNAIPLSVPDRCATNGQPLSTATVNWTWSIDDVTVADFTSVDPIGGFISPGNQNTLTRTTPTATNACSLQCLHPGSIRVPGICGNGVLDPGEECEQATFSSWCSRATRCLSIGAASVRAPNPGCGDGVLDPGEECELVNASGVLDPAGQLPPWCSPSCLNLGSASGGSACGNGSVAADKGEDCDDGNAVSGDGCSSQCLHEGTPPLFNAASPQPNSIVARCGDGIVDPNGGEECEVCANGSAIRSAACGGGGASTVRTEWATARCAYDRCLWLGTTSRRTPGSTVPPPCGNSIVDLGEQCDDGNASNGDGCSSSCLLEGASITAVDQATGAPRAAMCGDGSVSTIGGPSTQPGEACDAGNPQGPPDPLQIIAAVGTFTSATSSRATNAQQRATATISIAGQSTPPGTADLILQCGFTADVQCFTSTLGVDAAGCCRARPRIETFAPVANQLNVCRNATVRVQFDVEMDEGSVGVGTNTQTFRGGMLEACGTGTNCPPQGTVGWFPVPEATPQIVASQNAASQPASALEFALTQALRPSTSYRVTVFGTTTGAPNAIRSAAGVPFAESSAAPDSTWVFTTGAQVCQLSAIAVLPTASLIHQRTDLPQGIGLAKLYAIPLATTGAGTVQLTPIPNVYDWSYAWSSTAPNIAQPVPTQIPPLVAAFPCGTNDACAYQTPTTAENGQAFAQATATVTTNTTASACTVAANCRSGQTCTNGQCVGEQVVGRSRIRVFLCENPWPPIPTSGIWEPYPGSGRCSGGTTPGGVCVVDSDCGGSGRCLPVYATPDAVALRAENIAIAYCRDQGARRVCKITVDAAERGTERTCQSDSDCVSASGTRCFFAALDDLPAVQLPLVQTPHQAALGGNPRDLRTEFLLLPRGTDYCSVSGDPCVQGSCPSGEFCRPGTDAIGFRIYENEEHVSASRWFQQQGFTDAHTPVTVDGYRGVRTDRSVYVNVANAIGGSIYTNLLVFSVNDNAVAETASIVDQLLRGMQFNANLAPANVRMCIP